MKSEFNLSCKDRCTSNKAQAIIGRWKITISICTKNDPGCKKSYSIFSSQPSHQFRSSTLFLEFSIK